MHEEGEMVGQPDPPPQKGEDDQHCDARPFTRPEYETNCSEGQTYQKHLRWPQRIVVIAKNREELTDRKWKQYASPGG